MANFQAEGFIDQSTLTPVLNTPFLGRAVEICIVTPNLLNTLAGLCSLGIGSFKIFNFNSTTVTERVFRGESAEFEIKVAFASQGDMIWEVMQPMSGPSLMQEFLRDTNGKGGIHHVAFDCGDVASSKGDGKQPMVGEVAREEAQRRRAEFEKRGFPLVQTGVWHGKKGTCEFMFFDTEGAVATCFESYVFSDDWEDPEDTEHFPPQ